MNPEHDENIPADILESAEAVYLNLLPPKSRQVYELAYQRFMDWCKEKNVQNYAESVLMVYFSNLTKTVKPSTLWSQYSMLRSTLDIKNGVDISKYSKLRALLKRQSDGYIPKKSRVFTKEEVDRFLDMAPDNVYLMMKVVLVLGIGGAMRCDELVHLKIDDIEDMDSVLVVKILQTKNKKSRSFTIIGDNYLCLFRKYVALRPSNIQERRLFLKYVNGKCQRMVVGIHKISAVPQEIAKFLKLENWKEYTGHSLRRTSATLLIDGGGDLTCLKRHGGWKSSTVAEGYIEESRINKENTARKILQPDKEGTSTCSDISSNVSSTVTENILSCSNINENLLNCSKIVSDNFSGALNFGNNCSNCTFNITINNK